MVDNFGEGNAAKGWSITIGAFALLSIVFFVITFLSARERIKPDPKQKSSPEAGFHRPAEEPPVDNRCLSSTLFLFITLALWGSAMFYFFTYYVDKTQLFAFLQSWGLVAPPPAVSGRRPGGISSSMRSDLSSTSDRGNVDLRRVQPL